MSEIEKELEEKKLLLQTEILDKNYDQIKFVEFCLSRKPNGDDLSTWTLDELKSTIQEFTKQFPNTNLNNINNINNINNFDNFNNNYNYNNINNYTDYPRQNQNNNYSQQVNDLQKDIENMNMNVPTPESNKNNNQNQTIKLKCKILEKNILNDKQITVVIKNPKPVVTNFLSSNYVEYEVETKQMNWLVKRRYSDFEWLRQVLVKLNPGHMIPPLPSKKIGQRRFELDFIAKRMKFLQKFIDAVMENEVFKANEPLKAFLSMTDKNQFLAKMKELSSYQPSPYVNEYRSFDGEITIDRPDEGDKEKYFVNITNYFKIQSQLFDRLNSNFKTLHKSLTNSCYALNDIQRDFQTLHLLNVRVLMKDEITKAFEELGKFFKNWKRITYKQNEVFKTYLKDFFKYIRMECSAYTELIVKRNSLKQGYFEEQRKLNVKKEKLWANGDTSKWEIIDDFNKIDQLYLKTDKFYAFSKMCTQESNHVANMGNTLGFYNRQNMQELKKLMKNNRNKYMLDLKTFTDNFYPTLTDSLTVYTSIQMFVNSYQPKK